MWRQTVNHPKRLIFCSPYRAGNREALCFLAEEDIPRILNRLDSSCASFKEQWRCGNKPFGDWKRGFVHSKFQFRIDSCIPDDMLLISSYSKRRRTSSGSEEHESHPLSEAVLRDGFFKFPAGF